MFFCVTKKSTKKETPLPMPSLQLYKIQNTTNGTNNWSEIEKICLENVVRSGKEVRRRGGQFENTNIWAT
jgi:hypothetical protein